MKFSIYQPWIYLHGGLEKSLLELVSRSRHEWVIYTNHYAPDSTFEEFQEYDVRELKKVDIKRDIFNVLKASLIIGGQKLQLDQDQDGLVVWCDGVGDLITLRNNRLPVFNICSTPLRAVFDPVYKKQAMDQRGALGKLFYTVFMHAFKFVDRLAWRNYDGFISTSTEVSNRVFEGGLYQPNQDSILAYPGVEWSDSLTDVSYEKIILVPGRIMWTKNIELAIRSFLKAELSEEWSLVIAGFVDEKSKSYLQDLEGVSEGNSRVKFDISPSSTQLESLYRRASFILFPPLNEDWGIVPLEAMALGKPVIANNSGGPSESIVDGETGFLLPPTVGEWAEAIKSLTQDSERVLSMGQRAHRRMERYTWTRFVEQIDDALEKWVLKKR